jgi:hypothetical protein
MDGRRTLKFLRRDFPTNAFQILPIPRTHELFFVPNTSSFCFIVLVLVVLVVLVNPEYIIDFDIRQFLPFVCNVGILSKKEIVKCVSSGIRI